eukprot:TRINITY_DN94354_c0_g1_i1.p1 TRINITY_DN94354_c0_g1~~TRINITY_DN94354_c0_g1_i1.p1  ORF type:complete len:255 (-),score=47.66 TRINITY_DN94354_c0_g1_i1:108-872(-)
MAFASAVLLLAQSLGLNSTSATNGTLQNINFDSNSDLGHFTLDYDYSQHSSGPSGHFDIVTEDGAKALKMFLGKDDKTFSKGSDTYPRTELADHEVKFQLNEEYSIKWDLKFDKINDDYQFCFLQIFGNSGPNIFLSWQAHQYHIWVDQHDHVTFPGSALDDRGRFMTWEVVFKLGGDGYIKVYKDGSHVGNFNGWTGGDDAPYHPKFGIYTQHEDKVYDTQLFIRNLVITEHKMRSPLRSIGWANSPSVALVV